LNGNGEIMTQQRSIASWRFILALLFQLGLISAIPARGIYLQLAGEEITLQTIPVDPYDWLRGYSQTLRYEISSYETLKNLSGWKTLVQQTNAEGGETLLPGTRFYVVLQAPEGETETTPPPTWKGVAVSRNFPANLPDHQIAIAGQADYDWVDYGIETYYIPEAQRDTINTDIAQLSVNRRFVVEVKVDNEGNAIPTSLWIDDREYRF
jgi:uncharacterized membrane-anchored protein